MKRVIERDISHQLFKIFPTQRLSTEKALESRTAPTDNQTVSDSEQRQGKRETRGK